MLKLAKKMKPYLTMQAVPLRLPFFSISIQAIIEVQLIEVDYATMLYQQWNYMKNEEEAERERERLNIWNGLKWPTLLILKKIINK